MFTIIRPGLKIMSIQFLRDSFGKWFKDLRSLTKLVDESFVNKYWDVAQNSWKRASCNEILLQLSVPLYHLMQEQQRYVAHIGVDFSHVTRKLHSFIEECLLRRADAECLQKVVEYESVGELYTAFIGAAQRFSTVYIKDDSDGNLYFVCSNAWEFLKNLAQGKSNVATCNAATNVQNACRATNDWVCSQIKELTSQFMDNAEKILVAMFDVCSNKEYLQAPWSTSSNLAYLLGKILEFAEQFLDYIASLTALDMEFELELGWVDIGVDEFVVMDVPKRKKRRPVGQL